MKQYLVGVQSCNFYKDEKGDPRWCQAHVSFNVPLGYIGIDETGVYIDDSVVSGSNETE